MVEAREKVRELAVKMLDVVEDPALTDAEKTTRLDEYEPDLKAAQDEVATKETIARRKAEIFHAAGRKPGDDEPDDTPERPGGYASLGEQFVKSTGYRSLVERGLKGGNWTTGDVELKAELSEGTPAAPGPGYDLVTTPPHIVPGIVDIRFRPLVIEDLFPGGATSSPLIRYLVETTVTNAAAAVAEGALKPESAMEFGTVDETLHKVATFLPITDEMLEDWSQIQSYLNARLPLFIRQASEAQILSGDGAGANMIGLLNRPGLAPTITKGTEPSLADDNEMDAIYRQITAIRWTSFLEPDAIVINPLAWQTIMLAKNSQGMYYANGPFVGQQPQTLWGKRVVNTPAIAAGEALLGAFSQAAQLFTRGGIVVEASNSHADFFQRNKTAVRAERRLGLAIYRPGAFGRVAGL
ncbi:phage major capsid protein [Actinophytocola sediminis]